MEKTVPIRSKTTEMIIGKCKYIVTTYFKEDGRETAEQKMLRYVSDRIAADVKDEFHTAEALSL